MLLGAVELKLPFWKTQSIGNDFPLIHHEDVIGKNLPELAIQLSDRRRGVGGDGLLVFGKVDGQLQLTMFNPDGTEDFCGNGLRCAAWHAVKHGWVGDQFSIVHRGVIVACHELTGVIKTCIGRASYLPKSVPFIPKAGGLTSQLFNSHLDLPEIKNYRASALTTGSTHLILHGPLPTDELFFSVSPKIEHLPMFPERTSIVWTESLDRLHLKIRIWERGVGETLGCGTGSSAAAIDTLRRHGEGGTVRVDNPGGTVYVTAEAWDHMIMVRGTATEVYSGFWKIPEST